MRIAIVCDDLIQRGGQERVVLKLCQIFPNATLFSPVISDEWLDLLREKEISSRSSFLQRLPLKVPLNRFYGSLGLHILALENFSFDDFDYVFSVSSRFAHGIITKPTTKHISYLNSPGRMFWEPQKYFLHHTFVRNLLLPFLSYYRNWDFMAGHRPDTLIANSEIPKKRIKKYYHRNAQVIYPFHGIESTENFVGTDGAGDYFVLISRLTDWKRVDIAVEAFNKLGLPLKIVGQGPEKAKLHELSRTNIEFLGYVSETDKYTLISGCRALIQTQYEDFGIVPLEVLALGKPVIAYGRGGVLEIVENNSTGLLFSDQTAKSLVESVGKFEAFVSNIFNPQLAKKSVEKFSSEEFTSKIKALIKADS